MKKKALPKAQLGLGLVLKATEKEKKSGTKGKPVKEFRMARLAVQKAKLNASKKK